MYKLVTAEGPKHSHSSIGGLVIVFRASLGQKEYLMASFINAQNNLVSTCALTTL